MIDWEKIRQDFPVAKHKAYFLSAAVSPIPVPVFEALIKEYHAFHLFGEINLSNDLKRYNKLCSSLAELINTTSDCITFVQNTSMAMSIIALSFKNQIKKPFNIISMQDEFPSSTVPFEYQGIEMRYVHPIDSRYSILSILDTIDEHTLAVITSHVQYATGFRQDIIALGKELKSHGILFIVNATQAFPYYPVDVQEAHVDAMTVSLHKWGLTGNIGSMFFTTQEFRERFPAPWAGWLSLDMHGKGFIHTAKNQPFQLHTSAQRYECGTFNLQTILAFQTAIDYIKAIGIENIQKRLMELTDYLISGLQKLNITIISPVLYQDERSAIIVFTLESDNEAFIERCAQDNVCLSLRDGNIRAAVNIFNNFSDIDRLLEAPGRKEMKR